MLSTISYLLTGLTGPERYLILNPDKPRCGIIVYCPIVKSTIASLTTIATGKSTRSSTNKLICRHEIPDFQPVATNSSLRIKIQLNFLNFGRSLSSPCQLTRLTLWNRTRRCRGELGFYDGWMTLRSAKWILKDSSLHHCL